MVTLVMFFHTIEIILNYSKQVTIFLAVNTHITLCHTNKRLMEIIEHNCYVCMKLSHKTT